MALRERFKAMGSGGSPLRAFVALPLIGWGALEVAIRQLPRLDMARASERSTVVVDREGRLLRPFVMADGRWRMPVSLDEVDPRYIEMLVAYEDRRFYRHTGVDPLALARAGWQMARSGRVVSGGSTLTMQVARLLEPREERSLRAKARQALRAIELERRFSKREILELYLALAPFGGNVEGVRAAALGYFGREPKRLSMAEAALLVALPQAPETRRPDRFPEAATAARERVLGRIREAKILPEADLARGTDEPVPVARRAFPRHAAHRAEALVAANPDQRRIVTTYDRALQTSLEQLARERAEPLAHMFRSPSWPSILPPANSARRWVARIISMPSALAASISHAPCARRFGAEALRLCLCV